MISKLICSVLIILLQNACALRAPKLYGRSASVMKVNLADDSFMSRDVLNSEDSYINIEVVTTDTLKVSLEQGVIELKSYRVIEL